MLEEKSVDQIFGVLMKIKEAHLAGGSVRKSYQKAVKEIADLYHVREETIRDACRRRLRLNVVDEFFSLVERWLSNNLNELANVIRSNTNSLYHYKIDDFFGKKIGGPPSGTIASVKSPVDFETKIVTFRISKEVYNQMESIVGVKGKSIPEWVSETITEIVKKEFTDYAKKLIENMSDGERERLLQILQSQQL